MITYYCPTCWSEIPGEQNRCPNCGFELNQYQQFTFEEKLLLSLEHTIPDIRLLAIQILGELGSQAALPGLNKLLNNESSDLYTRLEVLNALGKIQGAKSLELLEKAAEHPVPLIRHQAQILLEKISSKKRAIMTENENKTKQCRFILVRHGQTEWNRFERFRGHADVPLDETGLSQAEATGRRVAAEWKPNAVYSSPLSRSVRTANAIASHLSLPVQIHPDLVDIDYGEWQGLTPDEVRQRWPEEAKSWYEEPEKARIPGGETLEELRMRATKTVSDLAASHPGQTIVLVGHTVINRIILLSVLGLTNDRFWHIKQDTCAINIFEARENDFVLETLNDTCHLRLKTMT